MKYVLGIDLGTSGTKTVLFDQYGTAVCSAQWLGGAEAGGLVSCGGGHHPQRADEVRCG